MVIIADEKLRKQLGTLTVPTEIKDESGNTLAHVLPPKLFHEMAQFAAGEPNLSVAAWKTMVDQKGGKPLEEILRQLGQS